MPEDCRESSWKNKSGEPSRLGKTLCVNLSLRGVEKAALNSWEEGENGKMSFVGVKFTKREDRTATQRKLRVHEEQGGPVLASKQKDRRAEKRNLGKGEKHRTGLIKTLDDFIGGLFYRNVL